MSKNCVCYLNFCIDKKVIKNYLIDSKIDHKVLFEIKSFISYSFINDKYFFRVALIKIENEIKII